MARGFYIFWIVSLMLISNAFGACSHIPKGRHWIQGGLDGDIALALPSSPNSHRESWEILSAIGQGYGPLDIRDHFVIKSYGPFTLLVIADGIDIPQGKGSMVINLQLRCRSDDHEEVFSTQVKVLSDKVLEKIELRISESTKVGKTVYRHQAKNNENPFRFKTIPTKDEMIDARRFFSVNAVNGDISLDDPLDYESKNKVIKLLTLQKNVDKSSKVRIFWIKIRNENDNPPEIHLRGCQADLDCPLKSYVTEASCNGPIHVGDNMSIGAIDRDGEREVFSIAKVNPDKFESVCTIDNTTGMLTMKNIDIVPNNSQTIITVRAGDGTYKDTVNIAVKVIKPRRVSNRFWSQENKSLSPSFLPLIPSEISDKSPHDNALAQCFLDNFLNKERDKSDGFTGVEGNKDNQRFVIVDEDDGDRTITLDNDNGNHTIAVVDEEDYTADIADENDAVNHIVGVAIDNNDDIRAGVVVFEGDGHGKNTNDVAVFVKNYVDNSTKSNGDKNNDNGTTAVTSNFGGSRSDLVVFKGDIHGNNYSNAVHEISGDQLTNVTNVATVDDYNNSDNNHIDTIAVNKDGDNHINYIIVDKDRHGNYGNKGYGKVADRATFLDSSNFTKIEKLCSDSALLKNVSPDQLSLILRKVNMSVLQDFCLETQFLKQPNSYLEASGLRKLEEMKIFCQMIPGDALALLQPNMDVNNWPQLPESCDDFQMEKLTSIETSSEFVPLDSDFIKGEDLPPETSTTDSIATAIRCSAMALVFFVITHVVLIYGMRP